LLRIGICMSSIFISLTRSSAAQARAGSTRTLKWYIDCSAWWSSLRKIISPLGVSKLMPSIAAISASESVDFAFSTAATTAIAAVKPPAVNMSGGPPKRFWCSATNQSFTGFLGMP
jgi:hypothetical protein